MIKLVMLIMGIKKVYKSDLVQGIINDKENQEMIQKIVKKSLKKFSN